MDRKKEWYSERKRTEGIEKKNGCKEKEKKRGR
jgi:hypothetical protein